MSSYALIGVGYSQSIEQLRPREKVTPLQFKTSLNDISRKVLEQYAAGSCITEMPLGGIEYLLKVLSKDLNTNVFDKISYLHSWRTSLGDHPMKCLTIQEWFFSNEDNAIEAIECLNQIPHRTIYYKPPNNWRWVRHGSKVYFIYSEYYESNSNEMNDILEIINEVAQ